MTWGKWVIGLVLASGALGGSDVSIAEGTEEQLDRVIIQVKGNNVTNTSQEILVKNTSTSSAIYAVDVPTNKTLKEYMNELNSQPEVVSVEPDYRLTHYYTSNDTALNLQSHHDNVETKKAWDKTKGSTGVIVAIIDDGIDVYHEDLDNNIIRPYDIVQGSSKIIPAGEHGTHIAGIIAGEMDNYVGGSGIAPNTKIMPINVFEGDGAYTSDIIKAIYHAVDNDADIINMSLGSYYYSQLYQNAIDYAHDAGLVIVAAAGNEATDDPSYPAAYNHVVSVASTTPWDSPSYFSNYGSTIDVSAPGSNIYSTLPYDSYGEMSGTSMASPVVAGIAALIKANQPSLTGDQIVQRLIDTTDDLGPRGKDDDFGYGRVNAAAAVNTSIYGPVTVDIFTDRATQVTGHLPYDVPGGTIYVSNSSNKIIGQLKLSQKGKFAIPVSKQPGGSTLYVAVEDNQKNRSAVSTFKVIDQTAPVTPKVSAFSDAMTALTGTAESNSTVIVMNGSKKVGQATAVSGKFSVKLAKQKAGTTLTIYAMDAAKNKSKSVVIKVTDKTAPPTPTSSSINTKSTSLTGKTEAKALVYLYKGKTKVASTKADSKGLFKFTFKTQTSGTKFSLYAVDAAKNKSKLKTITVTVFKTSNATYLKQHYAATKKGTMYKAEAKLYDRMKITGKNASYGFYATGCCVFGKEKGPFLYGTIGYDEKYPNHVGDIMTMPSIDNRKIKLTEVTSALGKPKSHNKYSIYDRYNKVYSRNNKSVMSYELAGTIEYKPTKKTTFWVDYDSNGYVRAFGLRHF